MFDPAGVVTLAEMTYMQLCTYCTSNATGTALMTALLLITSIHDTINCVQCLYCSVYRGTHHMSYLRPLCIAPACSSMFVEFPLAICSLGCGLDL
jgi:hypothetical protein